MPVNNVFVRTISLFLLIHAPAYAASLQDALQSSAFHSKESLQQLPAGLGQDYHPMPLTIAASLESREPGKLQDWRSVRLAPNKFSKACPNFLEAHWRPGQASAPLFLILPGSFSQFKTGGYTNQTAAVLDRLFPGAHLIALSGFQSTQFLAGRCKGAIWDMRGLGQDIRHRLGAFLKGLAVKPGKAGVIGFSGGATLAIEILAEDGRLSQSGEAPVFNLGGAAFSPILHGPTAFHLLDSQHEQSSVVPKSEGLTTFSWRTFTRVIGHLLLKGQNAEGVMQAHRLHPKEFVQRAYNEFTITFLRKARNAVKLRASGELSYTETYMRSGFQLETGTPSDGLEEAFANATDIRPSFASVRAPLLLEFSQDDPILSASPGSRQPEVIAGILRAAAANPRITVFNPPFGGHAAATLDPSFAEILQNLFTP